MVESGFLVAGLELHPLFGGVVEEVGISDAVGMKPSVIGKVKLTLAVRGCIAIEILDFSERINDRLV